MLTEEQIQNCKNIFYHEMYCFLQNRGAENEFDKIKEKIDPLADFLLALEYKQQDSEIRPELRDIPHHDPNLSYEENFRNGVLFVLNKH